MKHVYFTCMTHVRQCEHNYDLISAMIRGYDILHFHLQWTLHLIMLWSGEGANVHFTCIFREYAYCWFLWPRHNNLYPIFLICLTAISFPVIVISSKQLLPFYDIAMLRISVSRGIFLQAHQCEVYFATIYKVTGINTCSSMLIIIRYDVYWKQGSKWIASFTDNLCQLGYQSCNVWSSTISW